MNISSSFYLAVLQLVLLLSTGLTSWADDMVPYFTEEPVSTVTTLDASLTLPCRVHPPSAKVRWKFEDQLVDLDNSFGFTFHGMDLRIGSFRQGKQSINGNEGSYQCIVDTPQGTILSKPATISRAVLKKFEDREDLYLNISEGSNLVLPCQPPHSVPKAEIMYKVNNSIIDKSTDHYQILPSGNLLITEVTSSDQGLYQCMAHNSIRNRTRTANHVIHLHVLNTIVPSQEPAIIMPTAILKARVGENVVLECSAIGNPQPTIMWEKYGGHLTEGHYTVQYGNLYLQNVSTEDEGTYICKAYKGLEGLIADGLKALMLEVLEPPVVSSVREVVNTSVGENEELECVVTGKPQTEVKWFHNGKEVNKKNGDSKLTLNNIQPHDRGIYQCFVKNDAGTDYATIYVHIEDWDIGADAGTQSNDIDVPSNTKSHNRKKPRPAGQDGRRKQSKKDRKRKNKNKVMNGQETNRDKVNMEPPAKPEVKQLSDTSVMVNWTVPENKGHPITFFRIQYKEVAPKKGDWKTEDDEIKGHIWMGEVKGLKSGGTYKFRIAAVYSNNDNTHGPNSDRFVMTIDDDIIDLKPPSNAPVIVEVMPIEFQNMHALNVKWQQNSVSTSPIEGFYIFYKPYSAPDPLQNITLLQSEVRSHLLKNLHPSTAYLVKMQSFNSEGRSPISNQVVKRTNGPDGNVFHVPPTIAGEPDVTSPPTSGGGNDRGEEPKKSDTQYSSEMLYMVLGIIFGVMILLLIVFIAMCWWKQRQQRRMMAAVNDAVRNKFQDPSQRIYADSMRKKFMNGGFVVNGVNGGIANGHVPHQKMNINVNPLSEMDPPTSPDGSHHYMPTTFHPNGMLPGLHRASDNNCNNINRSKSLENSLQHSNQQLNSLSNGGAVTVTMGNGGVPHTKSTSGPPPIPNGVPTGHLCSDSLERCSNSNQSCDQVTGSHDQSVRSCDSSLSYDDTGGIQNGRHRKRRRRLHSKEQTTKDQATNTDLSSNEGTMDFSSYNKVNSSSQESDQFCSSVPQTYTNCEPKMFEFTPTAAGV